MRGMAGSPDTVDPRKRVTKPPEHHPSPRLATVAAQAGQALDAASGGTVAPLQPSTTYARDADYALINPAHEYGRDDNPTVAEAERVLALLEGASSARLFSSGMAGISALFRSLPPGGHIVAQAPIYYGAVDFLRRHAERTGTPLTLWDPAGGTPLADTLRPGETVAVWLEVPSNPLLHVADIAAAAEAAHAAGAVLAVDSTVATPVFARPLSLGADIVFHSATKYLNGHSDVLGGVLVTNDDDSALWRAVRDERHVSGAVLGAFDAWQLVRGLRTLAVRVRASAENAMAVAEAAAAHPAVSAVHYPGLPSHPHHAIAARQMTGGFGGLMSIQVRGGRAAALRVAGAMRVFVRATSLGGVESLVEHRHSIEPPSSGVPEDLLRLSVGIEDRDDLIEDLVQALNSVRDDG